MDTREQLAKARELIQARRFDEARALLNQVNHPTAKEWLAKLDQIAPQKSTKKKSSDGSMRVYLLVLVLLGVVMAGALVALNLSNSDDEEPQPTATVEDDDESDEGDTPETAQSAVSFDGMQPNTVEINITGDYTASGEPDSVTYIPEPTGLFAPRQIVFRVNVESAEEPPGQLVLTMSVTDDPPGTYPLVDVLREMSDRWGVVHNINGRDSWISPEDMAAVDIEGTINVVENGDTFTGSFEFTTRSTTDDHSMTVNGRINQLPFEAEG